MNHNTEALYVSNSVQHSSAAHSSRTLLRDGYKIPAVLKQEPRQSKSFLPAKIVLLCLVRIVSRHTARILEGQNPKEKCPFHFRKNPPPRKSKEQETFFLFGVAE